MDVFVNVSCQTGKEHEDKVWEMLLGGVGLFALCSWSGFGGFHISTESWDNVVFPVEGKHAL